MEETKRGRGQGGRVVEVVLASYRSISFFLVDFSDARRGFLCVCRCVCFRTFTKKKEKKISSATKHLVAEQQVFQSQSC